MPKVKMKARVVTYETRTVEITDRELEQFRVGCCAERIVSAHYDGEGEVSDIETSYIESESWELIDVKEPANA